MPSLSAFLGESPESIALPRPNRRATEFARCSGRQSKSVGALTAGKKRNSLPETSSKGLKLDVMLDRLEHSFHTAVETPTTSTVKKRCSELELVQPFREARDLMKTSLSDKGDRDRSQLAALIGENGGARVARARSASEEIVRSDVKIPTSVLLEFLATCDSCEQVLKDRANCDTWRRAQWLQAMRSAAEHYLARQRTAQKRQEELEESWLKANAVNHEPQEEADEEADAGAAKAPGLPDLPDLPDLTDLETEQLGLLSEFLGEYPPTLDEIFSQQRRTAMMGRLMQCMPNNH